MKAETKKYTKIVEELSGKYSVWEIWNDYVNMFSIAISNFFEHEHKQEREEEYLKIVKKYNSSELDKFCALAGMLVADLEHNSDQDILGEVYMELRIMSKSKGQYFTPYNISKMMAQIIVGDGKDLPLIMNEPTCGSGSNIIAAANVLREQGVNYQQNVYFVAQDIDSLVAKMCFIQMSLLGMPGVVVIGNTLLGITDEMERWYTPFHYLYGNMILMRYRNKNEKKRDENIEQPVNEKDWLLELVGLG